MASCKFLVCRDLRPCLRVCAEVIPEGVVMIRIPDDCAVNHNDLSLFAQLRVVLLETTAESCMRTLVVVHMAWRKESRHDSCRSPVVVYRMIVQPILAHSGTVT